MTENIYLFHLFSHCGTDGTDIYLSRFNKNSSIPSRNRVQTKTNAGADEDADGIRTKHNMFQPSTHHPPPPIVAGNKSVISGRWEDDNERLYAMEPCLRLKTLPTPTGIEPRTVSSTGQRLIQRSYQPEILLRMAF